jgi:2-dehydro-3-deoxyglucarate aldolase/4-hydroxy-2-oxoheptanedioate aldolase
MQNSRGQRIDMDSLNNVETFKAKMARDETCLGMVITLRDPSVSELAAEAGYDFTWIDMEHSAITVETALDHVMAVRGTGAAPLVRVPWNDPVLLKPVLDLAPAGVIIPMVCSRAEAERAVSACKYPPAGVRGMGVRRAARYGAVPLADYLAGADSNLLVMIQIEHTRALENLDEIFAVPGIDGVCVGPADLSASMGFIGQPEHPEVLKAIATVAAAARARGLALGTATGYSPESFKRWLDWGIRWIAIGGDSGCLFAHVRSLNQQASAQARACKGSAARPR